MSLKYLIVKTSALGDIVHALPLLDYLKEKDPTCTIDWVVEKGGSDLLKAHPLVHRVLPIESRKWKKSPWKERSAIGSFFQTLREVNYDMLFDLQGNVKSALITLLARAKHKVGFGKKSVPEWPNLLATQKRFDPPKGENIVLRNLFIVQKALGDNDPWNLKPRILFSEKQPSIPPKETKHRFMICFGSRWENKKLSVDQWRSFLEKIVQDHELYVVYGNEEERLEAQKILHGWEDAVHMLPPMPLPLWQNTMALMDGVIAVDSVGLHLAGLAGVPTFSFFGPSSAAVYRPCGKDHSGVQGGCPYGEVFDKRCSKLRTCATGACLKTLSAEELLSCFEQWNSQLQSRDDSRQAVPLL